MAGGVEKTRRIEVRQTLPHARRELDQVKREEGEVIKIKSMTGRLGGGEQRG